MNKFREIGKLEEISCDSMMMVMVINKGPAALLLAMIKSISFYLACLVMVPLYHYYTQPNWHYKYKNKRL